MWYVFVWGWVVCLLKPSCIFPVHRHRVGFLMLKPLKKTKSPFCAATVPLLLCTVWSTAEGWENKGQVVTAAALLEASLTVLYSHEFISKLMCTSQGFNSMLRDKYYGTQLDLFFVPKMGLYIWVLYNLIPRTVVLVNNACPSRASSVLNQGNVVNHTLSKCSCWWMPFIYLDLLYLRLLSIQWQHSLTCWLCLLDCQNSICKEYLSHSCFLLLKW